MEIDTRDFKNVSCEPDPEGSHAGTFVDKRRLLAAASGSTPIELELGCGERRMHPHAVGVDILDLPGVDVVGDVYEVLASLPAGSVKRVYSHHFMEHLDDLGRFFGELGRVVTPGGEVEGVVPHFSSPLYYSDPTHRSAFGLYTLSYFAIDDHLHRPVPHYSEPEFTLESIELGFKAMRPYYLRHAISLSIGRLVNSRARFKEIFEQRYCYFFPAYELTFRLRRIEDDSHQVSHGL